MLISILDNERIVKFNLPENSEETYLIKYRPVGSNIEKDLNLISKDNKWYIKSNGSIDAVRDNKIVDEALLELHTKCLLSVSGQKIYSILYCSSYNEDTKKYTFPNIEKITIGKNANCTISYNDTLMAPEHATIYTQGGKWYIKSSELEWARTYVNDIRIDAKELKTGDVIFIDGIKIIWMTNFLLINNPNSTVSINNQLRVLENGKINNSDYTEISEDEEFKALYDESECFTHVPRLKTTYDNEKVIIDEPPASKLRDEQPFLATIGTSLVLLASVATMTVGLINSISNGNANILTIAAQVFMIVAMLIAS